MLHRFRAKIKKRYFDQRCKRILDTPPVGASNGGPVIVTQLISTDLFMYLVAIKSLFRQVGEGRIVVLLDKDWPRRSLELLERHVRPWKIAYVRDLGSQNCPKGGTWERLLAIAGLVEDDYVVQLDADMVTLQPVHEFVEHVGSGTSFMIGTWKGQEIEPVAASAERVKENSSRHVQILAEQRLYKLDNAENLRYARGQSSFAGFAKGSFSVDELETLSEQMQTLLGKEKWAQWGSESFASNFCVANAYKAAVLPWPKYASFNPRRDMGFRESAFLHFEGTNRFKQGVYVECGRAIVKQLLPDGL